MEHQTRVLVTGAAGFIGSHVSKSLIQQGYQVLGMDNLNDYYDVQLKKDRLAWFNDEPNFDFVQLDLANREAMAEMFAKNHFDFNFRHSAKEYLVLIDVWE